MNEPRLIIDGEAALAEILASIAAAKKTIRIRVYMWRDDVTGRRILSALIEKIEENPNISIYIEKDAFGSRIYDLQRFLTIGRLGGDIFS